MRGQEACAFSQTQHIELAINIMGLAGCKPAPSPGVAGGSQGEDGRALDEVEARRCRSVTGVLDHLHHPQRHDAQFCIREAKDIAALTHMLRYEWNQELWH